ncbi:MAG: hypothetical protein ABI675_14815 [Chitinophagaceae bacterium]
MKLNRYLPFAFIYFFVNSLALPFGLTYTSLLAPFFYIWILFTRKKEILLPFIAILLPFIIVHVAITEVEIKPYAISLLNLLLVYIFCQAVYTFLNVCKDTGEIFKTILVVNFILCLISIPLYFTPWFSIVWDEQILGEGVGELRRLRLFAYEPSYYALLFTPFFFYFLLQYLFKQNVINGRLLLLMLFLPYGLSFSIGVIGAVFMALFITWMIHFRKLTARPRILNAIISGGVLFVSSMIALILFFRQNALFTRVRNILNGEDSSGKGRTVDAFLLAEKMLQEKSKYWGIGLGQIKIVGYNIIRNYYHYNMDITATIPSAAAETLAIFGWIGFILRITIEIFLFCYTKVWTNYYRLLLFFFIFIYQFTGSFITNAGEYVIWILAFTNIFHQFDVKRKTQNHLLH